MKHFKETSHLSEILEESYLRSVIIFIFSSQCGTSSRLELEIKQKIDEGSIRNPVYKVTVQTQPALSEKIELWFKVKHESPQIFLLDKGKVLYTDHHSDIDLRKLG